LGSSAARARLEAEAKQEDVVFREKAILRLRGHVRRPDAGDAKHQGDPRDAHTKCSHAIPLRQVTISRRPVVWVDSNAKHARPLAAHANRVIAFFKPLHQSDLSPGEIAAVSHGQLHLEGDAALQGRRFNGVAPRVSTWNLTSALFKQLVPEAGGADGPKGASSLQGLTIECVAGIAIHGHTNRNDAVQGLERPSVGITGLDVLAAASSLDLPGSERFCVFRACRKLKMLVNAGVFAVDTRALYMGLKPSAAYKLYRSSRRRLPNRSRRMTSFRYSSENPGFDEMPSML